MFPGSSWEPSPLARRRRDDLTPVIDDYAAGDDSASGRD
jgi:hypothetical protein